MHSGRISSCTFNDDELKAEITRLNEEVRNIRENRNERNQDHQKETAHYANQISVILEKLEGHQLNFDEVSSRLVNAVQRCKILNEKCDEICEQIQKKDEEIERRIQHSPPMLQSFTPHKTKGFCW